MIKTKTFQFLVSNSGGNALYRDENANFCARQDEHYRVYDEKAIDKKINAWIEKEHADVVDIKVSTYTVHRHNNGYQDSVVLVYTLLYREAKKEA